MSKLRKFMLAVLLCVMTVCAGAALAACGDDPDFINPEGPDDGVFNGSYEITVQSLGGLGLNDVKISVKKDGEVKNETISVDGKIKFTLDPDVYELVVDETSLPAGYFVPEGAIYKTSATDGKATVSLSSAVINSAAPAGTSYSVGDVMYDFSFTEIVPVKNGDRVSASDGETFTLSETLKTKKAVLLNFWGTRCQPCRIEFPAMQAAYEAYSDKLEIFALSSYQNDSADTVATFKNNNGYTFPMALDWTTNDPKINRLFGVSGYPTSVMIDRYGAVGYVSSGTDDSEASWRALFERFTKDDYTQEPGNSNGSGEEEIIWAKPDDGIVMPDSAAIAQAVNGNVGDREVRYYDGSGDEGNWAWVIDSFENEPVLKPSNVNTDWSYSAFYVDVTLKAGDGISYDYYTDTKSNLNTLYFLLNGKRTSEHTENSDGWKTNKGFYIANRNVTVQLLFIYRKMAKVEISTPVYIDNITVYNAAAEGNTVDLPYSVAQNSDFDETTKTYDVTLELENGIYYYVYEDNTGATKKVILYADILNSTAWSDLHYGSSTFIPPREESSSSYPSSLYMLSFWCMSNYDSKDENAVLQFKYETGEVSEIIKNYYLQQFSYNGETENGYVPVTPALKEMIIAFARTANSDGLTLRGDDYYEDQWLEFCYYFRHHGAEGGRDHECAETNNPVKGLVYDFALTANEGVNDINIKQIINIYSPIYEAGGGLKYDFVPSQTGVYLFTSTHVTDDEDKGVDPSIIVYDAQFNRIASQDDNPDPKLMYLAGNGIDFLMYVEMVAGETYHITACMSVPGVAGEFKMNISYFGQSASQLRVTATGDGAWTFKTDENGEPTSELYFPAIPVWLNPSDKIYYENINNSYSSNAIYIDFLGYNYFDLGSATYHYSLLARINAGQFDFTDNGDEDYTDEMLAFYNRSIAGKEETDELYGFTEASERLVYLLNLLVKYTPAHGDASEAMGWMMFASYYQYYGINN